MENELDARRAYLVSLEEIVDLKRTPGSEPSAEALAVIASTRVKIGELEAQLADRKAATDVAEENLRQGGGLRK